MKYEFETAGTCSRKIEFEINTDGTVGEVNFIGGCPGNLHALCSLVKGMKADEVISRLEGIDCRGKGTSCSDQFAQALKQALSCGA